MKSVLGLGIGLNKNSNMTKEELLALPRHSRVKYIGSDSAVQAKLDKNSKSHKTKGVVVVNTYDYSKSSYRSEDGLILNTWSAGYYEKVKPEDWEVVDSKRTDLARSREKRLVNRTDRWVKQELLKFSEYFKNMKHSKRFIDSQLNNLPLPDRLAILTGLTEEEKCWLDILDRDPETVIKMIHKVVKEDEVEVENQSVEGVDCGRNGEGVQGTPESGSNLPQA